MLRFVLANQTASIENATPYNDDPPFGSQIIWGWKMGPRFQGRLANPKHHHAPPSPRTYSSRVGVDLEKPMFFDIGRSNSRGFWEFESR